MPLTRKQLGLVASASKQLEHARLMAAWSAAMHSNVLLSARGANVPWRIWYIATCAPDAL